MVDLDKTTILPLTSHGQVVLVTGATDGLGRRIAGDLALQGATVLVHGRDATRGEAAVREIRELSHERVAFYAADLSSLSQVRALAEQVLAEHDRLDVLVNNAGIGPRDRSGERRELSEDGYELRFAVNYLAPYLLTSLLAPLLVRSAPARIVNIASVAQAPIDFDDVMLERAYDGLRAYGQSKLALVMLTFDLAEELRGFGVTVNSLHPATNMPTKLVREAGRDVRSSMDDGAHATLRLAVGDELEGVTGRYFDGVREARPNAQAYDADARRRLRELTAQLVGLRAPASPAAAPGGRP